MTLKTWTIAGVELWTAGHTVPLLQMPLLPCRRFFSGGFAADDHRQEKSVNNHRSPKSFAPGCFSTFKVSFLRSRSFVWP